MRRGLLVAVVAVGAAAASLGAAGCGSDSSSSTTTAAAAATAPAAGAGGAAVQVAADPSGELAFVETALTAPAGEDTFEFTNDSEVPHNFAIEAGDGGDVGATKTIAGGSDSVTVTLKPGTYIFYCQVPGHVQAGMKGTITVE